MVKLTHSRILLLASIWTVSLFLPLIVAGYIPFVDLKNILKYRSPYDSRIKIHNVQYAGGVTSAPVDVYVGPRLVIDDMNMDLKFRLDRYTDYANLFQTAPYNEGIRLEFSLSERGRIIAALIYRLNRETKVLILNDEIQLRREYKLNVKTEKNRIWVRLNGQLSGSDVFNSVFISGFILGNSFDGTRPFVGQIHLAECALSKVSVIKWALKILRSRPVYLAGSVLILGVFLFISGIFFWYIYYEGTGDTDRG